MMRNLDRNHLPQFDSDDRKDAFNIELFGFRERNPKQAAIHDIDAVVKRYKAALKKAFEETVEK